MVLTADRVIAVRDPWGFRPLSVGKLPNGGWAIASETCALRTLDCTEISEVAPGEIITAQGTQLTRRQAQIPHVPQARCTFEFVYFSRPDSQWDDRSVHLVRQNLGEQLAHEASIDADVVIPVPDSSIPAAVGFSRISGIPYNDGLIKNRYIGRTFIEPTQSMRAKGVAMKFNALTENLAGKRVIMIDDSLVRGTTAGRLVALIRDAGATEVHLRITCPPITHACHFGVDMGHDNDLISARLNLEELREEIGCDSLAFLSLQGMMRAVGKTDGYCNACFTGDYPIQISLRHKKDMFCKVLALQCPTRQSPSSLWAVARANTHLPTKCSHRLDAIDCLSHQVTAACQASDTTLLQPMLTSWCDCASKNASTSSSSGQKHHLLPGSVIHLPQTTSVFLAQPCK